MTTKKCIKCNRNLDFAKFYINIRGKPTNNICKNCKLRHDYFKNLPKRKTPIILCENTKRYNGVKDEFMYFVDASENPIYNLKATHLWPPAPAIPEHPPLTLENSRVGTQKKARWCCKICNHKWITTINSRFREETRVKDRGRTRGYRIIKPSGCPKCNGGVKFSRKKWIQKFNVIHNNKYDYSRVREIRGANATIPIICPEHGLFSQETIVHSTGHGCSKCMGVKLGNMKRLSKTEIISRCKSAHENCPAESLCHQYDYSKANYKNSNTPIEIWCPKHGKFQQGTGSHWGSCGRPPAHCRSCMNKGWSKMAIEYIEIMEKVYNCKFKTAVNSGEYKLENGKYLDAIDQKRKIIIEFHGCPWHGCPLCFPNKNQIVCKKSIGERYIDTLKKDEYIRKHFPNYEYITKWSHEFANFKKIKNEIVN